MAATTPMVVPAADSYPSKPVRIIVPYPAGGMIDTTARAVAKGLALRLGKPVVVENKPGASGIIGTDYVAKASPDGYTLLMTLSTPITANVALYRKLPYDPRTDLRAVSDIATSPGVLVVSNSLPVKSVSELISYAKNNPQKLRMGSWGLGSSPHLLQTYLNKTYGTDILHVPYKGEAPLILELLSGQINVAIGSTSSLRQHIAAGKIRPLAVLGSRRLKALPDVPSMVESGYSDTPFQVLTLTPTTLMTPAKTPPEILSKVGREVSSVVGSPVLQKMFEESGQEPLGNTPQQAQMAYQTYLPVILKLTADTGVTLD
nr:tripartite tricarboxylate transporter substrate binding protein [Cupriavidus sp. D384]